MVLGHRATLQHDPAWASWLRFVDEHKLEGAVPSVDSEVAEEGRASARADDQAIAASGGWMRRHKGEQAETKEPQRLADREA